MYTTHLNNTCTHKVLLELSLCLGNSSRKKTEEMASGIVALALEANPKQRLGEDIQHIVVGTSVPGKTMGKDRRLLELSKNGPLMISANE